MPLEIEEFPIIGRSELERFAVCPRQARLSDTYQNPVSEPAEVGQQIHDAIGYTVGTWVDSNGTLNRGEIAEEFRTHLDATRPDLQPQALDAVSPGFAWKLAGILGDIHPANILRYDGGPGAQSGQFGAVEIPGYGLRLTAEADLLTATESPEVVDLYDWKTGRQSWDFERVATCFQFNVYAWLTLQNYPAVNCVRVVVLDTRRNRETYRVEFDRRRMPAMQSRIQSAAGYWQRYRDADPATCEAWPTLEKCRICDVAAVCDDCGDQIGEAAASPEAYLDRTVAIKAVLDARESILRGVREERGEDIVSPLGNAYGRDKPRAARKQPAGFYESEK